MSTTPALSSLFALDADVVVNVDVDVDVVDGVAAVRVIELDLLAPRVRFLLAFVDDAVDDDVVAVVAVVVVDAVDVDDDVADVNASEMSIGIADTLLRSLVFSFVLM